MVSDILPQSHFSCCCCCCCSSFPMRATAAQLQLWEIELLLRKRALLSQSRVIQVFYHATTLFLLENPVAWQALFGGISWVREGRDMNIFFLQLQYIWRFSFIFIYDKPSVLECFMWDMCPLAVKQCSSSRICTVVPACRVIGRPLRSLPGAWWSQASWMGNTFLCHTGV